MLRTPWIKAAIALGALALLPVVHLWTIDRLDAFHRMSHRTSAASLARSFGVDDPPTLRTGTLESATATGTGKGHLPIERPVPVVPSAGDTASAELLTAPLSYWNSEEVMLSFGGSALLVGLALTMVVSIARSAAREPDRLLPVATAPSADSMPELARLAEQARADADDAVHAMRTPIATIMGYSDALKRSISPENAKAWRAVQAMDASTARLNRALDEAWTRADCLASLLQARREAVDLCDLARAVAAEASDRYIVGPAPAARYVLAPRQSLEETVRTVFEAFSADSDEGAVLAACSEAAGNLVRLTVSRDGPVQGEPVDAVVLMRWPTLSKAARLAGLLGGELLARATTGRLQEAVLQFPARGSS